MTLLKHDPIKKHLLELIGNAINKAFPEAEVDNDGLYNFIGLPKQFKMGHLAFD